MKATIVFGIVFTASLVLAPASARADCAEGANYAATVSGNTVSLFVDYGTPDDAGVMLLRQNEADGSVVVVAEASTETSDYYDECVPAGTYRYGFSTPFSCKYSGCGGPEFFTEVTVTAALSATCTRTTTTAPMDSDTVPPWDSNGAITQWVPCPAPDGGSEAGLPDSLHVITITDTGAVVEAATDSGAPASTAYTAHGGCAISNRSHTGVRAMMLAMLGAGLVLLGRRVRRAKGRS